MTFLPILKVDTADIPERVLVVGDPARVDKVTEQLTHVEPLAHNREYRTVKGRFQGEEIGVVSHGVGSAGAGACFSELCQAGVKRVVRAGSAGGMQADVIAGDVIVATAAVREDGLSHKLVPASYPATATTDITMAMRHAALAQNIRIKEGIVLTSDLFYPADILGSDLPLWSRAGVIAVEMEVATLFTICSINGVETGAVVAIDGNPLQQDEGSMETYNPDQETVRTAVANTLLIALAALIS